MAILIYRHHGLRLLALILLLLLTACGGGGGGSGSAPDTGANLSRIEVTPNQPSLAKGTALGLIATGIYNDNSTRTLTSEVTWLSSNDGVATISASGEISALGAGQTTAQANLGGISGNTELTITNATLSRLEISPTSAQLAEGTRLSLALVGHFSDGSTQDVAEQASWAVTDTNVASLSDPVISDNLWLTGLAVGNTQLSASLGGISAQMGVAITDANLVQLTINPGAASLPLGATLDLSALGLYSDGSSQDLTQQASWSSADTGILSVDDSGHIQPLSIGSTTVTAIFAGISNSQTVSISNALLTSIEVSSASSTIPLGEQQALRALGHYSDGSLQDITEQVTWQSTPTDRLAISNASGSHGLATALASGTATATAALGSITGALDLSITAATLSSIDISPLNARLAKGTQLNFRATGRYSDGTIQDVSEQVSWATGDTTFATVSNATGNQGQTLALSPGDTSIFATLDGVTGSATLTVTAAQLLSINVVPAELTLPAGTLQTVNAVGSFSDGSVQNLDDKVTWESDSPSTATVSNGKISALQAGSARISASWEGISGNTNATVTNATLSSLAITPNTPALAAGTNTQLHVTAIYSDGSQEDVTTQATWSSADDALLRVENSAGQQGRLTALSIGATNITTSFGGMQVSVSVNIGDANLTDLQITAASTNLDSAEHQQLTATGTFSDDSSQDLTAEVIWNSDAPELAQVSNNDADRGRVMAGIGVSGVAVITASYDGFSSSLNLTINNTPQRPVSLVVLATPNVIHNDGIDASYVEIRVQAASPNATVAPTTIDLEISLAGILLSSQSLVTIDGIASTSFTTTETGLLQIEASIPSTPLSNSTALYASSAIAEVIALAAFANIQAADTQILSGSRFGFFMYNLSNRDFPLLKYELLNGSDVLASTIEAGDLNNNVLSGGLKMGIIYTLTEDITNQGIVARYYLTDPASGNNFSYSVTFTTP